LSPASPAAVRGRITGTQPDNQIKETEKMTKLQIEFSMLKFAVWGLPRVSMASIEGVDCGYLFNEPGGDCVLPCESLKRIAGDHKYPPDYYSAKCSARAAWNTLSAREQCYRLMRSGSSALADIALQWLVDNGRDDIFDDISREFGN